MLKLFAGFALLLLNHMLHAQNTPLPYEVQKPKLIVGIVVDQMRYDILWRYWSLYGNGGFKRLVTEGFECSNTRFNFMSTVTAVGHASIYTGTTPSIHGIVENYYYDRKMKSVTYVVSDTSVRTVGNPVADRGMSPFRLNSTTITDELKLASKNSKVIGIAIKDRSAIIPAGHLADGAYYYDSKTGNWIGSTWYTRQLPAWLEKWNKSKEIEAYLRSDWNLLLPRKSYTMCTGDTTAYEHPLPGETLPVFPHKLGKGKYATLPYTPFGLTLTKDMAIAAIENEKLGKRDVTDFLCVSFSSTDIVQHYFGQNSLETADCYVRLDRELENLLSYLDGYLGKENVLVFLTADHGGALNPEFAKDHRINAGTMLADSLTREVNAFVSATYGKGEWVAAMTSQQVYMNKELIRSKNLKEQEVAQSVISYLMAHPGVQCATAPEYGFNTCSPYVEKCIMNGYYPERSGDVQFSMKAGWIDWIFKGGTSHGTVFDYDQHVPLIWYGWRIQHGESASPVVISDIAPTIARWLTVSFPSGCTGNPITAIPLK
jgi:predicted AlkP superfamily pyrophosphatase or phosphodiesterase